MIKERLMVENITNRMSNIHKLLLHRILVFEANELYPLYNPD